MNKYIFVGTEKDLLDNGFVYRPHYNNYSNGYYEDDYKTKQDFYIQIDHKSGEVDIYIQCLSKHRNMAFIEEGNFNLLQADIYPIYFEIIKDLIEKGIIKVVENE